jgi:hypothetical protein
MDGIKGQTLGFELFGGYFIRCTGIIGFYQASVTRPRTLFSGPIALLS